MSTITVPEPDAIGRMSLKDAKDARAQLANRAANLLAKDLDEFTSDDAAVVADIQSATGALGDRIDSLKEHADRREHFKRMQEAREEGGQPIVHAGDEGAPTKGRRFRSAGDQFVGDDTYRKHLDAYRKADGERFGSGAITLDTDLMFKNQAWAAEYKGVLGMDDTLAGVDSEFQPAEARIPGLAGVTETLFQAVNIANLFPNIPWGEESVTDMVETLTDTTDTVAEAAAIPELTIDFAPRTVNINKIGNTIPTTLENLGQEAFMRSFISNRLRDLVLIQEDIQLLLGTGTDPDLTGLIPGATGNTNVSLAGTPTGQDWAEAIHASAVDIMQAYLDPTAVVVSADGWGVLRLAKDLDGQYLNAVITDAGIPRIWGLPLVVNNNIGDITGAVNTDVVALVVSRAAADVYRRTGVTVSFTDSHASEFTSDIVRFKATERLAVFIRRAAGLATVTAVT